MLLVVMLLAVLVVVGPASLLTAARNAARSTQMACLALRRPWVRMPSMSRV